MSLSTEKLGKITHFLSENVESDTEINSWCFVLNEEVCTVNALLDYRNMSASCWPERPSRS